MVGNLGCYKFTQMPFGLCDALATFQHLMQNTLSELNLTYCIIYLDNVIMFWCMEEEHLEHLQLVFECFREFSLKLKPSKCSFFQLEIVYLVHHMSQEGIHPSWDNVWAIEDFLMPEMFTQFCTFCGLVGHYQCFIKGFTHLSRPLYDVLGKEVKMGPVELPPRHGRQFMCWSGQFSQHQYWCFPTLRNPFFWKPMLQRKVWGQFSPRNRKMDTTIP